MNGAVNRDYDDILRRALHAAAESVEPSADGLERIRERLGHPPLLSFSSIAGWYSVAAARFTSWAVPAFGTACEIFWALIDRFRPLDTPPGHAKPGTALAAAGDGHGPGHLRGRGRRPSRRMAIPSASAAHLERRPRGRTRRAGGAGGATGQGAVHGSQPIAAAPRARPGTAGARRRPRRSRAGATRPAARRRRPPARRRAARSSSPPTSTSTSPGPTSTSPGADHDLPVAHHERHLAERAQLGHHGHAGRRGQQRGHLDQPGRQRLGQPARPARSPSPSARHRAGTAGGAEPDRRARSARPADRAVPVVLAEQARRPARSCSARWAWAGPPWSSPAPAGPGGSRCPPAGTGSRTRRPQRRARPSGRTALSTSAAATAPAVEARSTVGPSRAPAAPDRASSSASAGAIPPSGPTISTTSPPAPARPAGRQSASAGQRIRRLGVQQQGQAAPRGPARPPPRWTPASVISGNQARRDCLAAATAVDRQRATPLSARSPARRPRSARPPRAR